MKLHLPCSLRHALMLALGAVALTVGSADAAYLHSDVSLLTYTDFGQNMGRYAVGNTNALLDHIRAEEGVVITYTGGQASYTLEHDMIDFSSQCDGGYGAAIGYNWCATVQHNGVLNNTYTANSLGSSYAIHYVGIEYRSSEGNKFLHTPSNDYKITRQSKLVTDVTGSTVYGSVDGDYSGLTDGSLKGQYLYRAGSGTSGVFNYTGGVTNLAGAYVYITGGIDKIDSVTSYNAKDGAFSTFTSLPMGNRAPSGITSAEPLPFQAQPGDSGSPTWVWNEKTGQYEYLNAVQSVNAIGAGAVNTQARGACEWTVEVMDSYNKVVDMTADATNTVHITGVTPFLRGDHFRCHEQCQHHALLWDGDRQRWHGIAAILRGQERHQHLEQFERPQGHQQLVLLRGGVLERLQLRFRQGAELCRPVHDG